MGSQIYKAEDYSNAVITKIAREKLQGFDAKHTRQLFDIIQLLIRAKVKSLSDFLEIVHTTKPEVIENCILEMTQEIQPKP